MEPVGVIHKCIRQFWNRKREPNDCDLTNKNGIHGFKLTHNISLYWDWKCHLHLSHTHNKKKKNINKHTYIHCTAPATILLALVILDACAMRNSKLDSITNNNSNKLYRILAPNGPRYNCNVSGSLSLAACFFFFDLHVSILHLPHTKSHIMYF